MSPAAVERGSVVESASRLRNIFPEGTNLQEKSVLSEALFFLIRRYAETHGRQIKIGHTFVVKDMWKVSHTFTRVKGGYLYKGQIYQAPY